MPDGKPMPIFLDDIKELLDPQKVKERMGTLFQLPNLAYKLTRILSELLKTTLMVNQQLAELNEEVKKVSQELSEVKQLLRIEYKDEEVEDEEQGELKTEEQGTWPAGLDR